MNIYINDLSKYYKNKKALDHITLHLSSGIYGLIGPNGAGKTRMSVWIDENTPELNVHRISAQKSLDMPEYVSPTALKKAEDRFLYGTTADNSRWLEKDGKRHSRWGNNPETHMLNDYRPLMVFLMTENFEKSII